MTPDRHAKIRAIFLEAIKRPSEQRDAYLDEACAADGAIRNEVNALFAHHTEEPAPGGEKASSHHARAASFVAGEMIAQRYRIQCQLGSGGMGVVYRAEDIELNQAVAIKFLAVEPTEAMLQRFRSEVRMAHRVTHPNVCRVFDIGSFQGLPYITMEYCDGEDLAKLLRRVGRLSPEKACEIARQICAGLAAAHGAGVLHRDLKPANILLDAAGKVSITDFGIAAAVDAVGIRETAGTPGYMAPEQFIGIGVDERSDMYSLGLVLYELFSGRPAFDVNSSSAVLEQQLAGTITPISDVVAGIDPDLDRLIQDCTSKQRAHRPSSALQVAAAIPGVDALRVAQETHLTAPPGVVEHSMNFARRIAHPGIWAAVGIVALLFLPVLRGYAGFAWDAKDSSAPNVLLAKAKSIVGAVSPEIAWAHTAYGYCDSIRARRLVEQLVGPLPSAYSIGSTDKLYFWYRLSDSALNPATVETLLFGPGHTTSIDPSIFDGPQILVLLDDHGRMMEYAQRGTRAELTRFSAEPQVIAASAELADVDPDPLPISWTQPVARNVCVAHRAIQAKSVGSVLVRCQVPDWLSLAFVMEPNGPANEESTWGADGLRKSIAQGSLQCLYILATLFSLPLAARNIQRARSDTLGATRLFLYFFVGGLAAWILRGTYSGSVDARVGLIAVAMIRTLGVGAIVAILYVALEPVARKTWPHALISWTRLLRTGSTPLVFWHHLLAGTVAGCVLSLLFAGDYAISHWLHQASVQPVFAKEVGQRIVGFGSILAGVLGSALSAAGHGLLLVLLLALGRWAFGNVRFAVAAAAIVLMALILPRQAGLSLSSLVIGVVKIGLELLVTIRFGLLSLVVLTFVSDVLSSTPMTLRTTQWSFSMTATVLAVTAAIMIFAFFRIRRKTPGALSFMERKAADDPLARPVP